MAGKLVSLGGGSVTIADPASTASNFTLNPPLANGNLVSTGDAGTVTPVMLSQKLTQGTSAASTSGTAIDFTSIPSWVKRITVMFNGVSLSGTSHFLLQLGVNGSPVTSGYSAQTYVQSGGGPGSVSSTAGIPVFSGTASYTFTGTLAFTQISGNTWIATGTFVQGPTAILISLSSGSIALGGTVNMVRITSVNGTDTFDAGSINILYE